MLYKRKVLVVFFFRIAENALAWRFCIIEASPRLRSLGYVHSSHSSQLLSSLDIKARDPTGTTNFVVGLAKSTIVSMAKFLFAPMRQTPESYEAQNTESTTSLLVLGDLSLLFAVRCVARERVSGTCDQTTVSLLAFP